jgi:hypothetical protein
LKAEHANPNYSPIKLAVRNFANGRRFIAWSTVTASCQLRRRRALSEEKRAVAVARGGSIVNRSTTSYIIRLIVLVVSIVFIGADLVVSAQNTNSSTTMQEDTSMQSNIRSNSNTKSSGGRRRRGRRRSGNMNTSNANSACGPMQEENTNMAGETQANTGAATGNMNTTPVRTGRCDPMAQEQTDLSGTYTGTVNYAEGGLSGDTTLTINGNDFTMTSGSTTQEGRVVAVTTCNYTAVTMMFGKNQTTATTGAQPSALPAVSLRAKKVGNGLTLESVGGETRQFSFMSAGGANGGGMSGAPRGRRGRRRGSVPMVGIKPPTAMSHAY